MNYEILSIETLEEIETLKRKYKKALELLVEFNLPCENDDFNTTEGIDYCSKYCSVDEDQYKYCWDKYIEWKIKKIRKL